MRIREFLKSYPEITLSVEEVGDFFKAELRIASQVTNLLKALEKPVSRRKLQEKLGLRNREHFRRNYLQPALKAGLVISSNPDKSCAAD